MAIAVALTTYPIIRTLTRRLERLQNSVQKWGEGGLAIRVAEVGQDEVAFLAWRFSIAAKRVERLVKSIAIRHGGTAHCENRFDRGLFYRATSTDFNISAEIAKKQRFEAINRILSPECGIASFVSLG